MSTQNSDSCNSDDFFTLLNGSLTTEYQSQIVQNLSIQNNLELDDFFVLLDFQQNVLFNLIESVNNVHDTTVTAPLLLSDGDDHHLKNRVVDTADNISVDMFAEFEDNPKSDRNINSIGNQETSLLQQEEQAEQMSSKEENAETFESYFTYFGNADIPKNICQSLASTAGTSNSDKSTYCDEYENWKTMNAECTQTPDEYQNTTKIAPNFSAASPNANTERQSGSFNKDSVRKTLKRSASKANVDPLNIQSDANTTICEEFETWTKCNLDFNTTDLIPVNLDDLYSQCFSEKQGENSHHQSRDSIQLTIEQLMLKILNDMRCGRKLTITVANRLLLENRILDRARLSLKHLEGCKTQTIQSQRKLAMLLYVVSIIYQLILKNTTCTRREIFYSDPEFILNQTDVDAAIIQVCVLLNSSPWELGILSTSKGLIAGEIKLILDNENVINVHNINGGIALPHLTTSIKKVETSAEFVLLVEKATVYEHLIKENVLTRLGRSCILITGKGYPDINTRVILKRIWDECNCPIYALVDADPHGIEIMLTYRHGSLNMSFCAEELAVPSIRWIGVYPSEIKTLGLLYLSLTKEDLSKINNMIKRPYISKAIFDELLILKATQRKAEIEAVISDSFDWISYLLKKIEDQNSI